MKSASSHEILFTRRPSGAVRLNIGLGLPQSTAHAGESPATAPDEMQETGDIHPLLLLYPFDAPKAGEKPTMEAENSPAEIHTDVLPIVLREREAEVFDLDLDDPSIEEEAHPAESASSHGPQRTRRKKRPSYRNLVSRMRLPGVSEMEGLWARHGMLLSALVACHAATSYQMAGVYRHFMKLSASPVSLMPAMFLGLLFASFVVIRLFEGRRFEVVAIAIISMTGGSALIGLLCKVVLIVRGMA